MVQTRLKRKPPWTNETSDGSGVLETERTSNSPLLVFFFLSLLSSLMISIVDCGYSDMRVQVVAPIRR
jgi:hypothetical protein